jgi:hypothetical protein
MHQKDIASQLTERMKKSSTNTAPNGRIPDMIELQANKQKQNFMSKDFSNLKIGI